MPERGPTTLRSPRSRAIDVGTNPAGFSEDVAYDSQAGVPTGAEYPVGGSGGTYQEQPPAVSDGGSAPINQPSPFKLGGG